MPIVFLVLAPRADVGCSANFAMANFAVVLRFTTQLATGDTYRATCCAVREGICEAQVMRFIRVFTGTVQKRLSSTISPPRTEAARNAISRQFHQWSGMTGALGAVDGSHIPVSPPKRERGTYINRKGWYSIILSAVVDGRGRFLDISTGWPGRASDAAIIKEQALWERCERDGDRSWVPSPYFILGDSACVAPCHMSPLWQCASGVLLLRLSSATPARYPHRRWLQKGFPAESAVGDDRRTEYNEAFSQTRVIVECAFGKLKGQWRCLHVGLRQKNPADWSKVVHCCCIYTTSPLISADRAGGAGRGTASTARRRTTTVPSTLTPTAPWGGSVCTSSPFRAPARLQRPCASGSTKNRARRATIARTGHAGLASFAAAIDWK